MYSWWRRATFPIMGDFYVTLVTEGHVLSFAPTPKGRLPAEQLHPKNG